MTRILKPLTINNAKKLSKICGQALVKMYGLKVVDGNLGYNDRAMIDLLAVDENHINLVTIDRGNFNEALFRSFSGYRWFRENRSLLKRIYSSPEVNLEGSSSLLILSSSFPPDTCAMLKNLCTVPLYVLKYTLFGSEGDPEIFIEDMGTNLGNHAPDSEDIEPAKAAKVREELNLEIGNLTDEEIKEFLDSI
ncbi:MAG: hypothetical protein ACMUJM_04595 [bacterium]